MLKFRLFKYAADFEQSENADLHFTLVLDGNEKVISMTSGRAGLPRFEYAGYFILKDGMLFEDHSLS